MAYDPSISQPVLIAQGIGGGKAVWQYQSTDNTAAVVAGGYFTNGRTLGMKVGDAVLVIETDNNYLMTTHSVIAVGTPASPTASLSAAT